ncbi:MAG: 23S ribosomal RNA methyltransferase Erm [Ktedonobacteraceae bacterium]|nr:23S ribosomal RNA methyltransferase Erm [Ktedonobacteraceae bacterium]
MSAIERRSVSYSQNFLKSPALVDQLLNKSDIHITDIVYEIGPGKGIITGRLAQRCRQVIAIEKDYELAASLRSRFAGIPNVKIHIGDFLEYRLPNNHYKVFANIPFNITSAVVTHLISTHIPPDDAYLVMQREAAEKFLGQPRESLYAILLKPTFELELLHCFRRSDFVPVPRVDVVMLRLRKRGPPLVARNDMQLFRDFVVYVFTMPQPSLRSTLNSIFTPPQLKRLSNDLNLDLARTPTTLSLDQWLSLFHAFKLLAGPQALSAISGSERCLRQQQARLDKVHRTHISSKGGR